MSDRRITVVLALLAVGLVVVIRQLPLSADIDAADYHNYYRPLADAIIDGDGIRLSGVAAVRYPPGYPLLLATASVLPGGDTAEITVLNALSLAAIGVLTFSLMKRLASRRVAAIAAVAVISYPLMVYSAAGPSTELPFIALMLAAVLLALVAIEGRWWAAAAAGGVLGVASLVRPAGLGVGLVLAVLIVVWQHDRRALTLAAVLIGANLLLVMPWELWAWQQTDEVLVLGSVGTATTVSGLTLVGRNEAGGRTIPVPDSVDDLGQRALRDHRQLATTGDVISFLGDEFHRSPTAVTTLFGLKAIRSWYGTDSLRYEDLILLIQLPYLVLAAVGAWANRRRRVTALSLAMVAYFWLTAIAAVSIVRYLLPGLVFVVILAALGVDHLVFARRRSSATASPEAVS